MVLLGNSTQTNCSRSNSVVSLSGKEQISPILLLSASAPDNHNEVEQSRMASATRSSLRCRKKSSLGVNPRTRSSNGFVGVKDFVSGKQTSPVTNDTSSYFSLVDFLSKTPCDSLPLEKNGISSLWTCGQCCQTFLSNSDFEVHLTSHNTMSIPAVDNNAKPVIAINKKRQSSEEPVVRKRLKRSSSPDQLFVFNAETMQEISSNGEKFYKCDICDQLYATSDTNALKIHYLRSHINYQFISSSDRALCSIVDDGLKSKVTDFLYRCYFCNISCAEKQIIIEHNSEHKSNVFRCDHCHSVFYQNKAFTNHMKNCSRTPCTSTNSILCLHCKEPTWFEDRDTHTREYHCYSNGIIRVECVYGCVIKTKKLCELYKHYASVHRDVYFSCTLCKIRFVTADELCSHNKTKHNIDITSNETKKQTLAVSNKSDVNHIPKKSKILKSSCDTTQATKISSQIVAKSNSPTIVKNNNQTINKSINYSSSKPNSQTCLKSNSQTSLKPNIQTSNYQTNLKSNNHTISSKPNSQTSLKPNNHVGLKPNNQTSSKPNSQTCSKPNNQTSSKPNNQTCCKPNNQTISKPNSQTSSKPNSQSCSKSNNQTSSKPNNPTSLKPNNQTCSKPNNQISLKPNSPSVVSPPSQNYSSCSHQQQYLQDILFKSILKIDLIEQVHVLKKHAEQYPDMLSLPPHPVFAPEPEEASCCPGPSEEEFLFPVFSSSEENNVYICKTCGLQGANLSAITAHMTSAHPYIHNEYFVFNKEDLPNDFWNLSHLPEVKKTNTSVRSSLTGKPSTSVRNSAKSTSQNKCSCCAFECKEKAEFHKHLLQCAKKQKLTSDNQIKSKIGDIKKQESPSDSSRRRMVITGVLRQVPDDILFSYKKELEKTIRKPGDSETVFNMLNKLPSKRLVKTTERYDSLYYKNNKAMKPKRNTSSMERVAQFIHEKDPCFSLSDYLKYFIHNETPKHSIDEVSESKPLFVNKPSNELNKVVDKKIKVVKSSSNEELNKVLSDKKMKIAKTSPTQGKDGKVMGDKKAKSPKLNSLEETCSSQLIDSKKLKVHRGNHVDDKKSKLLKVNGACGDEINKLNDVYSSNKKLHSKEAFNKVGIHKERSDTDKIGSSTIEIKYESNNMTSKSLQNVKVVPIHYPTLNVKTSLLAHTKCKNLKTTNKSNKNILVEMKGKNVNASVGKKGKLMRQVVKKKLMVNKKKATKLNGLVKMPNIKTKIYSHSQNATVATQELSPRQKHTSSYVVISDTPLVLPLPTTKREKSKKK